MTTEPTATTPANGTPEDLAESLGELDHVFRQAEEPEDDFVEIPDGNYLCELAGHRIEIARKGKHEGSRILILDLVVEKGDFAGRHVWKTSPLVGDVKRMGYIKRDLRHLGVQLKSFGNLPEELRARYGARVQVRLYTNGDYQNVYLKRALKGKPGEKSSA